MFGLGGFAPSTDMTPPAGTVAQLIAPANAISISDATTGVIGFLQISGGNPNSYSNPVDGGGSAAVISLAMFGTTQIAVTLSTARTAGDYSFTVTVDNTAGTSAAFTIPFTVFEAGDEDVVFATPDPPSGRVQVTLPANFPTTAQSSTVTGLANDAALASWTALKDILRANYLATGEIAQINLTSGVEYNNTGSWDFPFSLVGPINAAKLPLAYVLPQTSSNSISIANTISAATPLIYIKGVSFQPSVSLLNADVVASTSGPTFRKGGASFRNDGKGRVTVVSCRMWATNTNGIESDGADLITDNVPVIKFYDCDIGRHGTIASEHNVYVHRGETWFVRCTIRDTAGGGHVLKSDGFKLLTYQCHITSDSGDVDGFGTFTITHASGSQDYTVNGFRASGGSATVPSFHGVQELARAYCRGTCTGLSISFLGSLASVPIVDGPYTGVNNNKLYAVKKMDTVTGLRVVNNTGATGMTLYFGFGVGNLETDSNVVNTTRIQDVRTYKTFFRGHCFIGNRKALYFTPHRTNAFGGYHPTKFPFLMDTIVCPPGPCTPWKSDGYSGSNSNALILGRANGAQAATATKVSITGLGKAGGQNNTYVLTAGVDYTVRALRIDATTLEFTAKIGTASFTVDVGTNTVTLAGSTLDDWINDARVRVTGAALPSPLVAGTQYRWTRLSATTGRFKTNGGTTITLTTAGTPTHTIYAHGPQYAIFPIPASGTVGGGGTISSARFAVKLAADDWDVLKLNPKYWDSANADYFWGKATTNGVRKTDGTLDFDKLDKFPSHFFEDCMFSVDMISTTWTMYRGAQEMPNKEWGSDVINPEFPSPPGNSPDGLYSVIAGAADLSSPLASGAAWGTQPSGFTNFDNPGSVSDIVCAWPSLFKNIGPHRSARTKATGGLDQFDQFTAGSSGMGAHPDLRVVNSAGTDVQVTTTNPITYVDTDVSVAHLSGVTKIYVLSTTGITAGMRIHIEYPWAPGFDAMHVTTVLSVGSDGGGPFINLNDATTRALNGREAVSAFTGSTTSPSWWIGPADYGSA